MEYDKQNIKRYNPAASKAARIIADLHAKRKLDDCCINDIALIIHETQAEQQREIKERTTIYHVCINGKIKPYPAWLCASFIECEGRNFDVLQRLTAGDDLRAELITTLNKRGCEYIYRTMENCQCSRCVVLIKAAEFEQLRQFPKVLASVMRGLEQAKAGQFSKSPPDLDADQELADADEDDLTIEEMDYPNKVDIEVSISGRNGVGVGLAYMRVSDHKVARTIEIIPDVMNLDVDSQNQIVGVELLSNKLLEDKDE